jgi:hypothetical protein
MPSESLQTPSRSADAPARGPGWSFGALQRPAYVRTPAGWMSSADRLWLDWITQTVEEVLRSDLGVRPTITPTRSRQESGASVVFAASWIIGQVRGEVPRRCVVALRLDAARAVADSILVEASGLQGRGGPTQAELGVLEFVALVLTDAISRRIDEGLGSSGPAFSLERFAVGEDAAVLVGAVESAVSLAIDVSGRHGEVVVSYEGWRGGGSGASVVGSSGSLAGTLVPRDRDPAAISVGLALSPVIVKPDELRLASPGDAIMLGCSELGQRVPRAVLATRTGWSLCAAEIVHDSPTALSVSCHPLSPEPLRGWMSDAASIALTPMIGEAVVTSTTLREWSAGRMQDLDRASGEIELWLNASVWATGELARVGDEAAVRLLKISTPTETVS